MKKVTRNSMVENLSIIKIIKIESITGQGTLEDPVRPIIEYYDFKGNLLARYNGQQDLEKIIFPDTEKIERF